MKTETESCLLTLQGAVAALKASEVKHEGHWSAIALKAHSCLRRAVDIQGSVSWEIWDQLWKEISSGLGQQQNMLAALNDIYGKTPALVGEIVRAAYRTYWESLVKWNMGLSHAQLAWETLGRLNSSIRDKGVVEELLEKINDESAVLGLSNMTKTAVRHPAVIPALLALVQNRDTDRAGFLVRWAVAQALGDMGEHTARHPEVISALLALLQNRDTEWDVRSAVAGALGDMGEHAARHPEGISALLALLQNRDTEWNVRWAVAKALGNMGEHAARHPEVIPAHCSNSCKTVIFMGPFAGRWQKGLRRWGSARRVILR